MVARGMEYRSRDCTVYCGCNSVSRRAFDRAVDRGAKRTVADDVLIFTIIGDSLVGSRKSAQCADPDRIAQSYVRSGVHALLCGGLFSGSARHGWRPWGWRRQALARIGTFVCRVHMRGTRKVRTVVYGSVP